VVLAWHPAHSVGPARSTNIKPSFDVTPPCSHSTLFHARWCALAHGSLLANDINNGIEHGSDFRSGSLQGNTFALDQLGKPLDPLRGNGFPCEIILDCTPCFNRQQYLNGVLPHHWNEIRKPQ
jgi:hypothetical protein